MNFILTYKGRLKSRKSANVEHKHAIRRVFHRQLKVLWDVKPLKHCHRLFSVYDLEHRSRKAPELDPSMSIMQGAPDIRAEIRDKIFASVIHPALGVTAEIKVKIFYSPTVWEDTEHNISADLDNRMKTLVDALRRPRNEQEYPESFEEEDPDNIFFCVLDDDSLISSIKVESALYLDEIDDREVYLVIDVSVSTKFSLPPGYQIGYL